MPTCGPVELSSTTRGRTVHQRIDAACDDPCEFADAAARLRAGGLVAFPTETVYGLGAFALRPSAVKRIFDAKQRPANNPTIVHVADADAARRLTARWSAGAQQLAERFWPGPLTIVAPRAAVVPDRVTAGGPTVALRIPAHPVARALLEAARIPIAAPSANRSGFVSPTRGEHVLDDLDGRIDWLIDAGPTPGGIESTVIDVSRDAPCVLRPGPISLDELSDALGLRAESPPPRSDGVERSPGRLARHYSPRAPLLVCGPELGATAEEYARRGAVVGVLAISSADRATAAAAVSVVMPHIAARYAARLYAALRELDGACDVILVEALPDEPEWWAVRDRVQRAAAREESV